MTTLMPVFYLGYLGILMNVVKAYTVPHFWYEIPYRKEGIWAQKAWRHARLRWEAVYKICPPARAAAESPSITPRSEGQAFLFSLLEKYFISLLSHIIASILLFDLSSMRQMLSLSMPLLIYLHLYKSREQHSSH